jgi:hypothetical protein
MSTKDVLFENIGSELFRLWVVAGESLVRMRDKDSTVAGTLERAEDARASCRAFETNIKVGPEGSGGALVIVGLGEGEGTVWFCDALVFVGKFKFGQSSTGDEETGGVGFKNIERVVNISSSRERETEDVPALQFVRPCLMPYRGSSLDRAAQRTKSPCRRA